MNRCLSTGGAVLLFKPIPQAVAEASYQTIVKALGLAEKSPEERIEALLSLPQDDLWQKVPPTAPLLPVLDEETVPGSPDFSIVSSKEDSDKFPMPGRKWCDALMIGESKLDVSCILRSVNLNTNNLGKHPCIFGHGCTRPQYCTEIHRLCQEDSIFPFPSSRTALLRLQHHP